ncbi:MAG: hypothetical protein R8K21_08600 [Mariprofundales bacterium]
MRQRLKTLLLILFIFILLFPLVIHAKTAIIYNISIDPVWWQYSENTPSKLPAFTASTPLSSQAHGTALQTSLSLRNNAYDNAKWQWQITTSGLLSAWHSETWQVNNIEQRNQLRLRQWEITTSVAYAWKKTNIGPIIMWINQQQSRQKFNQSATHIVVNNDNPVNENIKILAAGLRIAGQTAMQNGQLQLSFILATPLRLSINNDLLSGREFTRHEGILWRIKGQWLGDKDMSIMGGIPVLGVHYHERLLQGEQTSWGLWPRNRWRQIGLHAGINF